MIQNYAAAYRMMGWVYLDEVWFGMTKSPAKSIEKAEQMAQKATSLKGYQAPDYSLLSCINCVEEKILMMPLNMARKQLNLAQITLMPTLFLVWHLGMQDCIKRPFPNLKRLSVWTLSHQLIV